MEREGGEKESNREGENKTERESERLLRCIYGKSTEQKGK